ncbi:MAG: MATE family efflux transporter [Robiginitomaculum sp.]
MTKKGSVDLTQGSVPLHILRMLGPSWLAILAMMSAGVVDTIYLGRLSTNALAAIAFCFPVIFLGNSINIGIGAGTLSAISRDLGRKDYDAAHKHGAGSILLAALAMLVVSILGLIFAPLIVSLMGATSEVKPLALDYLKYALPALIFMGVGMMCNNTLRANGEAVLPSTIMVSGAILNIIIDPLLIFGIGPFPRLEVEGAAIGTLISSIFTAFYGLYLVVFNRKTAEFKGLTGKALYKTWSIIGRVGIPAIGGHVVVPFSGFIATTIIARILGKIEVAAFVVAARTEMLGIALLYALSACIGANTGQNGGAGLTDRVREAFRFSYKICLYWGLFIAAVSWVLASKIPAVYSTDPAVITAAAPYFKIVPITLIGYGVVFVSAAGLNGLGRPEYGLVYTIVRSLVLFLAFIWIGVAFYGLTGAYYGMAFANMISGFIALYFTVYRVPMSAVAH